MDELQQFVYSGKELRIQTIDGNPWWCASDVTSVLKYTDGRHAIQDMCDEKGVRKLHTLTSGGMQQLTYINEPNLYRLIARSTLPEARKFESWIFEEVLPQIRKTGSYGTKQLSRKELALLVIEAEEALEKAQAVIAEQAPKVALADQCLIANNSLSMGEAAKILGTGRTRLFQFLREKEILLKSVNVPYQQYIDARYFEVKAAPIVRGCMTFNKPQTFVFPKGLDYIRKLLDENKLVTA